MADYNYYLDVNGISKHIGGSEKVEYNERNPGFGLSVEQADKSGWYGLGKIGQYLNSYGDTSRYVGIGAARRYGLGKYYMDVGAIGGVATGYDNMLSPLAAGLISIGQREKARLNLMLAPPADNQAPSLLMMNLGIPFR